LSGIAIAMIIVIMVVAVFFTIGAIGEKEKKARENYLYATCFLFGLAVIIFFAGGGIQRAW